MLKNKLKKLVIIGLVVMLVDPLSLTVSADRFIDDQKIKVNNENKVEIDGEDIAVNGENIGGTNNTSIGGMNNGSGGGGATGNNEKDDEENKKIEINISQNVEVTFGSHLELSAYLAESVQGLNRSTFIPSLERFKNMQTLETSYSAINEFRNFDLANKRNNLYTQDEESTFSPEYIEALNWLYKHNYIHGFEDVNFSFQEKNTEEKGEETVADNNANGNEDKHILDVELPEGNYELHYDMFTVPDELEVLNSKGEVVVSTGGKVSGKGTLKISSEGDTYTVVTNGLEGIEGTAWKYEIIMTKTENYISKNVTDVSLTDQAKEETFFYPKKDGKPNTIQKKDYIMQLMKVVDGVEESRPLLFESRYEIMDFDTGQRAEVAGYLPAIETPFKEHVGSTGIDMSLSTVDIDFNRYGMSKYYVNPNVYELYLSKAFNSGIIYYDELADEKLKNIITTEYKHAYSSCLTPKKEVKDSNTGNANQNGSGVGSNNGKTPIDPHDYLTAEEIESVYTSIVDQTGLSRNDFDLEFHLLADGNIEVSIQPKTQPPNSTTPSAQKECGVIEQDSDTQGIDLSTSGTISSLNFSNTLANSSISDRTLIANNGSEDEEDDEEGKEKNKKPKRSKKEYDLSIIKKYGSNVPEWDNKLGPVRINFERSIDNNGEYNVMNGLGAFGSSWSNPLNGNFSDTSQSGSYTYNSAYQYFTEENLSYIDAVLYAYRAINAYADEKLPQREVDIIMSMYSVNYGSLTDNEITALNYLIAKGIIDGDNSAKFTSTQDITVEDALILTYRIANPDARLTFKTNFGDIDAKMLTHGYSQSKVSISTFQGQQPSLDVISVEPVEYYIIQNDNFKKYGYDLSTARLSHELDRGIKKETFKYNSKDLSKMGIKVSKGDYTVVKYSVPWDLELIKLGYTHTQANTKITGWIDIPLGGGFYLLDNDSIAVGPNDISFARILPDMTKDTQQTPKGQTAKVEPAVERKGFFASIFDFFLTDKDSDNGDSLTEQPVDKTKSAVDSSGTVKKLENQDVVDDNDPLNILKFANPLLRTLIMEEHYNSNENKKVYIGINESAKKNILLDGRSLFLGGELNKDLITKVKDIESIKLLESIPTDQNGQPISSDKSKTFLEFIFPANNRRSVTELQSLVKRRLTLSGESEIENDDIASYTGGKNGQTLVSRKELSLFGVSAEKESPDILYHAETGTYAYLNVKDNYALISNTIMHVPEDSLIIEISADEVYYNLDVVMSMMNSKDYFVFNDEGKYQVITTLKDIETQPIISHTTSETLDTTFVANVEAYKSEKESSLTDKGKYLNISSISGRPATFFMSRDSQKKFLDIYGFEPYYVKSEPSNGNGSVSTDEAVNDLLEKNADILFVENVLINNSIVRNNLNISKNDKSTSNTFLYIDNAVKVTKLTKSSSYSTYAELYLDFINDLYNEMSEDDIKNANLVFKSANSQYMHSKFSMTDLLDRSNFINGNDEKVAELIKKVKGGSNEKDTRAFWVLYFLDKFDLEMPYEEDISKEESTEKMKKALITQFNARHQFSNGLKLSEGNDINLLERDYVTETDIKKKRRFEIKRMYKASGGNALMTTDEEIYINVNDAVYLKLLDEHGETVSYDPIKKDNGLKSLNMSRYMSSGSLTDKQISDLEFQRQLLGNTFFVKEGKVYNAQLTYYTSLPDGRKPLSSLTAGTAFKMNTGTESLEMVVLNNSYIKSDGTLLVKVAKQSLRKIELDSKSKDNEATQIKSYFESNEEYVKSLNKLGQFIRGVNRDVTAEDRILTSSDFPTGNKRIYYDYENKKGETKYRVMFDATQTDASFKELKMVDTKTNSTTSDSSKNTSKLSYYDAGRISLTEIINSEKNFEMADSEEQMDTSDYAIEYLIYDTYMFDYGAISVDNNGFAHLDLRTDNVLNTAPVVTDLVNELVKALKRESVGVDSKKVGDLVRGDKLQISDSSNSGQNLMLLKTDTKELKGHSHFISAEVMDNTLTPSDIQHSNSILVNNYTVMDSIKIWVGGQSLPLYNFIGNRQLNLAKPADIIKHKGDIVLSNLTGESKLLVETRNTANGKPLPKKFVYKGTSTGTSIETGETKDLTVAEQNESFNYILSLYLNSNLLVKKNDRGFYEIDGYGENGLINTSAFTSRVSRFEGVKNTLLTVLPTYSEIDGKFLGFDLTELEIKSLRDLFSLKWWSNFFSNLVVNIEIVASAFGFYYIYALMVLVVFTKSLTGFFQTWSNNILRVLTFGKINVETIDLRKFIPKCLFVLVLLTFTSSGYIRDVILVTEEVRVMILETFIFPFTK